METTPPASLQLDGAVCPFLSSLQRNRSGSERSFSGMAHKTPFVYIFPCSFSFQWLNTKEKAEQQDGRSLGP